MNKFFSTYNRSTTDFDGLAGVLGMVGNISERSFAFTLPVGMVFILLLGRYSLTGHTL